MPKCAAATQPRSVEPNAAAWTLAVAAAVARSCWLPASVGLHAPCRCRCSHFWRSGVQQLPARVRGGRDNPDTWNRGRQA
jgi:hypothetical protein